MHRHQLRVPRYSHKQILEFFQELHGYEPRDVRPFLPVDGSALAGNRILFYEDSNLNKRVYVKTPLSYGPIQRYSCTYKDPYCDGPHPHAVRVGQPLFDELKEKLGRKLDIIPKTIMQREPVRKSKDSGELEERTVLIMKGAEGIEVSRIYLPLLDDMLEQQGNFLYNTDNIVAIKQAEPSSYGGAPSKGYEFKPSELASALGQLLAVNELFFDIDLSERHIFYDNEVKEAVWIDQGKAFSNSFKRNNEALELHIIQIGRWAHAEELVRTVLDDSIQGTGQALVDVLSDIPSEQAKHIISVPSYERHLSKNKPEYHKILKRRIT